MARNRAAPVGLEQIGQLWLDYDLGAGDTVEPVAAHPCRLAAQGRASGIGQILVHSANIRGGASAVQRPRAAGFEVSRDFRSRFWVRAGLSVQ